MKFATALSVVAACAMGKNLQENTHLDYQYMQYAALFNKHTHSLSEYNDRMVQFGKTQKYITEFNAKMNTHFLGHNAYSDWTDEERAEFLSAGIQGHLRDHHHMKHHYARLNTEYLPDYVNWLEHGAVTPVKHDLATCAASWAHAAVDAIAGDVFLKNGTMEELSAQQIIDCDHDSWGCHGGLYTNAFEYGINNSIMSAKDYPYTGKPQACTADPKKGKVKVTNFINILPHDPDQLKMAVKLGPVAASITTSSQVFQFYKGGVISHEECSKAETPVDSAVTIVGFGHDQHLGLDYWLIKNSWGTTWGDSGFARIAITSEGPGFCNI